MWHWKNETIAQSTEGGVVASGRFKSLPAHHKMQDLAQAKSFLLFDSMAPSIPPGQRPATQDGTASERGTLVALLFALVAQRLAVFYEHHQWPTEAQSAASAADWLSRSRRALPLDWRKRLAALSDELARRMQESVSREAGLFIAHELNEALDPNYHSELAQSVLKECEQLVIAAFTETPGQGA